MKLTQSGIDLIKQCEGLRLTPYKDSSGLWTIGIGHLIRENEHMASLTEEDAEKLLREDLDHVCEDVTKCVTVPLNDNQFSALVCFAYNVGVGALRSSTLLKKLNAGNVEGAEQEFLKWDKCKVNGVLKQVPGLMKRRALESMLFSLPA